MSAALDYSRQEMMAIATGREIRDGELAIFGVGLSMLAGFFAHANHAPNLRSMTEGGVARRRWAACPGESNATAFPPMRPALPRRWTRWAFSSPPGAAMSA
jgi:hypothetical protein